MNAYKYKRMIGLCALLLLAACGGGSSGDGTSTSTGVDKRAKTKWTYMVYMAADNNLSDAGIADINEMETVGSTDNVTVVAQAEFSTAYSKGQNNLTKRGKIIRDNNTSVISSLSDLSYNADMGKKETLTSFIQWAKTNYPADNYVLVLWSHGDGWKSQRSTGGITRGALSDDTSGTYMAMPDIVKAIAAAGGVSVVDFDACLMGMYEVAYQMRNVAQAMVASSDLEPGDGNPYGETLTAINNAVSTNTMTTPLQIADISATQYVNSYAKSTSPTPKSAIDLTKIAAVDQSVMAVSVRLQSLLAANRTEITLARDQSLAVGYDEPGNVDMLDLFTRIKNGVADGLLSTLIDTLLVNVKASTIMHINTYTSTNKPQFKTFGGLAIYFPSSDDTTASTLVAYRALDINSVDRSYSWPQFVTELLGGSFNAGSQVNTGGFSYKVTWSDPKADLDLIIAEPQYYFLISEGTSTTNGFYSEDSAVSGIAEESYTAKVNIESGQYDSFVNYVSYDGKTDISNPTITGTIWLKDPLHGMTQFQKVKDFSVNFSNASNFLRVSQTQAESIINTTLRNQVSAYSDFVYGGYQTRSVDAVATQRTVRSAIGAKRTAATTSAQSSGN